MGLFSFIGGLLGAGSAKKASRRAETAHLELLNRALGESTAQRTQDRADFAPFREAGVDALGAESDLVGLNGAGVQGTAIEALRNSPLFQMLFRNGEEAVLQNASATGGLRGGNIQRGLADFGADTLAQVIERQLERLGGIAGRGAQATAAGSASGQNMTQQISQILGNQGQVRAGGILTRGGINSGMWQNAGSFLDDSISKIFKAITGGAGF